MSHRIARLFEPLLRFLRRPGRDARRVVAAAAADRVCRCLGSAYDETAYVKGPTVHHTGSRPPQGTRPVPVLGIGIGSCGMGAAVVEVTR